MKIHIESFDKHGMTIDTFSRIYEHSSMKAVSETGLFPYTCIRSEDETEYIACTFPRGGLDIRILEE